MNVTFDEPEANNDAKGRSTPICLLRGRGSGSGKILFTMRDSGPFAVPNGLPYAATMYVKLVNLDRGRDVPDFWYPEPARQGRCFNFNGWSRWTYLYKTAFDQAGNGESWACVCAWCAAKPGASDLVVFFDDEVPVLHLTVWHRASWLSHSLTKGPRRVGGR